MKHYTIEFGRSAAKDFDAIRDRRIRDPIKAAVLGLADDPRAPGCLKLAGRTDEWRVRVGTWRVVYRVEDGRLVVVVVEVGPRGKVYR